MKPLNSVVFIRFVFARREYRKRSSNGMVAIMSSLLKDYMVRMCLAWVLYSKSRRLKILVPRFRTFSANSFQAQGHFISW